MTRTTYRNHPHAVLFDAARQLRSAARMLTEAADIYTVPDSGRGISPTSTGNKKLREAETNIEAARLRMQSYDYAPKT